MAEAWVLCRCKRRFEGPTENDAWEAHRRHCESLAALDEDGIHDVIDSGKPLTYPEPPDTELAETLRWVAQTVHQAHHQDQAGGVDTCKRSTCMAAHSALEVWRHEHAVSMPGVLAEVPSAPGLYCPDPGAHAGPAPKEGLDRVGKRPPH